MKEKFSTDELFLCKEVPNYALTFNKIINAYQTNKEKAIRLSKESIKNKNTFILTIEKFQKKFSNADDYMDILNDILLSYDEKEEMKNDKYVDYHKVKTDNSEFNKIINEIYNSGLSVIDYYFYNTIPDKFSYYLSERIHDNNKQAIEISNRKVITLPLIIEIIKKINNKELDYVGYYEETKLKPYYLVEIARNNGLYCEYFADYVSALKRNKPIIINHELNGTLIINEEEVPKELKEQAIEYLKSIEAPINTIVYNDMIKRLVKKVR